MNPSPFVHWYEPREVPITLEEIRAALIEKPSYVASPHFLRTTSWAASISQDTLRKATLIGLTPFIISIIGVVSTQDLYMRPHGNFSSDSTITCNQTTKIFAHAEFKFSLSPPIQYPIFMDDFNQAIRHIHIIHHPMDTPPGEYCWENETPFIRSTDDNHLLPMERKGIFNWSFPIFRKTGLSSRDDSNWADYRAAVDPKYVGLVEQVFEDFDIRHLNITRNGGEHLKVEEYQSAMEGSLVEVQFRLDNVYGQGLSAEPTWIWIIKQGS